MSTRITADNGIEITVGLLALEVTDPEYTPGIYARLTDAQRVELAAALDPGRRGLHVRLDNQAATLATYRRERDAAVARAEQAEMERERADCEREEIADQFATFRAEIVAEAVKARESAVTRADIEKVVEAVFDREAGYDYGSDKPWPGTEPVSSAVWDYLKGSDPAVYVVRESDIAAVDVIRNKATGGLETRRLIFDADADPDGMRKALRNDLGWIAEREAIARAIEAEQAVDPVEAKARELYEVGNPGTVGMWESIHEAFKDGYRRIARHVLGQEASSDE